MSLRNPINSCSLWLWTELWLEISAFSHLKFYGRECQPLLYPWTLQRYAEVHKTHIHSALANQHSFTTWLTLTPSYSIFRERFHPSAGILTDVVTPMQRKIKHPILTAYYVLDILLQSHRYVRIGFLMHKFQRSFGPDWKLMEAIRVWNIRGRAEFLIPLDHDCLGCLPKPTLISGPQKIISWLASSFTSLYKAWSGTFPPHPLILSALSRLKAMYCITETHLWASPCKYKTDKRIDCF